MDKVIDFARVPAMTIRKDNRCVFKQVNPENIFMFPRGILGFECIKKYVFLINEKVEPFIFMHAIDDSNLSFVCIEAFIIRPDYNFTLAEENIKFLALKTPCELMVLNIVTVRKKVEDITANLMSPLLVNIKNSMAMQLVLDDPAYPVKYNIWESIENSRSSLKVS